MKKRKVIIKLMSGDKEVNYKGYRSIQCSAIFKGEMAGKELYVPNSIRMPDIKEGSCNISRYEIHLNGRKVSESIDNSINILPDIELILLGDIKDKDYSPKKHIMIIRNDYK